MQLHQQPWNNTWGYCRRKWTLLQKDKHVCRHSLLFGDVVFDATSTKRVHLHNFGDLGVKFRFDTPPKLQNTFSVEPAEAKGAECACRPSCLELSFCREGYAAPRDDVLLQVKFHPQRLGIFTVISLFRKSAN